MTVGNVLAAATLAGAALAVAPAMAQDLYLGQVIVLGTSYCPNNTVEAAGQILQITQYAALYSLYGSTYGGDGRATFALPDLRPKAGATGPTLKSCIVISGYYPTRP